MLECWFSHTQAYLTHIGGARILEIVMTEQLTTQSVPDLQKRGGRCRFYECKDAF